MKKFTAASYVEMIYKAADAINAGFEVDLETAVKINYAVNAFSRQDGFRRGEVTDLVIKAQVAAIEWLDTAKYWREKGNKDVAEYAGKTAQAFFDLVSACSQ